MAKKPSEKSSISATARVIVTFRDGLFLGQIGKSKHRATPPGETTAALASKLGKALNKPGISKAAVFGKPIGKRAVYAYSIHPDDHTKLVRESFDGKRTVGRMVEGKFRAIPRAP